MRAADVGAVARIERELFGAEAWPRAAFAYLQAVFAATGPPRGRLWVAEDQDRRVLGYVGAEFSALGGEADLINIAVTPAARRQGVGHRLLTTAVDSCLARRMPLVWLRVRAGNRGARAFYRRCGFVAVGRFRGYYDEPREDAVLMTLDSEARPAPRLRSRQATARRRARGDR